MAPRAGFEPATNRLTVLLTELSKVGPICARALYNTQLSPCDVCFRG